MHFHEWKILYLINISIWKFVSKVPLDNNPSLVWIMAWRRIGDKSLSELMLTDSLTHICYIRVRRIKWSKINIVKISHPYICFLQVEICALYVTLMWYVFQLFIFILYIYISIVASWDSLCRFSASAHNLKQCWLITNLPWVTNRVPNYKWNFNKKYYAFYSKFHYPALQDESFISWFIVPSQFLRQDNISHFCFQIIRR